MHRSLISSRMILSPAFHDFALNDFAFSESAKSRSCYRSELEIWNFSGCWMLEFGWFLSPPPPHSLLCARAKPTIINRRLKMDQTHQATPPNQRRSLSDFLDPLKSLPGVRWEA